MIPAAQAPDADSLRRVLHAVFAHPIYHWTQHPDPLAPLRAALVAALLWWSRVEHGNGTVVTVIVALAVAAIVAITAHAIWVFTRAFRRAPPGESVGGDVPAQWDQPWYHAQADRLAATGHFAEAMQAEFVGLVLALDALHVVHYHPSKTPGEYAGEITASPVASHAFRSMVGELYRCAFGGAPCGPDEFRAWRALATVDRYAPAN